MSARVVELPTYRVSIGAGLLDTVGRVVREVARAHRYAIITDDNVGPHYAVNVRASFGGDHVDVLTIPSGEAFKTRNTWASLTDDLLALGFGRDSTILALGGGVVGDVAGFVAATYMRGIPYVHLPTTLLAMIDASIGGKTGVDTRSGKNLVGAFHQPTAVIADTSSLRTLPADHLRAGLAEAIKHAIIADVAYLDAIAPVIAGSSSAHRSNGLSSDAIVALVTRSVEIKAEVVRRDERESGIRKTLNFGHTIGHAVERCSDYRILHGDAVAIGMAYEAMLAERIGVASAPMAMQIQGMLRSARLPTSLPHGMPIADVVSATHSDKKARAGEVEYALPAAVGRMAGADRGWSIPVADDVIRAVLETGVE